MSRVFDILYACALVMASPWLLWRAIFRSRNRRGWGQKLFGLVPPRRSQNPCVWLHAVSVGEVNLIQPVIDGLRKRRPNLEFVISTTTEAGFDLAQQKYHDHSVLFCPFDFSWAIKRVIGRLRPDLIVLAELEVWPNLIATAQANEIPVAVVNGRLSESSFRGYRRFGWLLGSTFRKLTSVSASTQAYADRFAKLGTPKSRIQVTGSTKFDGVPMDRKNEKTRELVKLARLEPDDFVMVAGSTQPGESLLVAKIYQKLVSEFSNLRLILVPRHPETCSSVQKVLQSSGLSVKLRSKMDSEQPSGVDVILVDVIGELSAWWGCANVAFVGGSMGGTVGANRGGQNMIEPAAYGVPVSFGPDTRNFREIVTQLLDADAATAVDDEQSLAEFFRRVITEPAWAVQMGMRARKLVVQHAGASDRTVDGLVELLGPDDSERARAA